MIQLWFLAPTRLLTTVCNSSPWASDTFFWLHGHCILVMHRHNAAKTPMKTHKIKTKEIEFFEGREDHHLISNPSEDPIACRFLRVKCESFYGSPSSSLHSLLCLSLTSVLLPTLGTGPWCVRFLSSPSWQCPAVLAKGLPQESSFLVL